MDKRHLVQLLEIRILIPNSAQSSVCCLLFNNYSTDIGNGTLNKFRAYSNRAMNFHVHVELRIRILIAYSCKRWRRIFNGLLQDWGPRLITLSARSISLDSTFNDSLVKLAKTRLQQVSLKGTVSFFLRVRNC